jgi:DNA-directed RNA polymerase omega subunit
MRTPGAVDAAQTPPSSDVGEELQSKFCLVTVTFQRAKQLQNGARPRVDAGNHKFTRVAMLEVMSGMVSWSVT